jgi:hypothetical protein
MPIPIRNFILSFQFLLLRDDVIIHPESATDVLILFDNTIPREEAKSVIGLHRTANERKKRGR